MANPKLPPANPRDKLSAESRKRIDDAHQKADLVRWEAEATISSREVKQGSKEERIVRNEGNFKAARFVLEACAEEFSRATHITPASFREIMLEEVEAACNSIELYDTQRRLLEVEFSNPRGLALIPRSGVVSAVRQQHHAALDEVSALGLSPTNETHARDILGDLNVIFGRFLEGKYRVESGHTREHWCDAYHAIAQRVVTAETADEVLERKIPFALTAFSLKLGLRMVLQPDQMEREMTGPILQWKGKRLHMKNAPSAVISPASPAEATVVRSVDAQIDELRKESNLTVEGLAEKIGVSTRTVQRHIADSSMPYPRHLTAYMRLFSKSLRREVFIRKMS